MSTGTGGSGGAPDGVPLEQVMSSARGWHGVQLAVLGFIGLCGVLQGAADPAAPRWLQIVAAVLVLAALVLQCAAVVLVAGVAWPIAATAGAGPERARRRLRAGVAVTFVAVALLALGAMSSWWPRPSEPRLAEVSTSEGVICGELREAPAGVVQLDVAGRVVSLALSDVTRLRPVDACP